MKITSEVKKEVQKVIDDLMSSNSKGGEITLDAFCSKVPNVNRWEVVTALRNASDGVFVTGRRGLKSRFIYGEPAKPMAKSIQYRQDYRKKATRKSHHTTAEQSHAESSIVHQSFALKIGIGDQSTTIPVTIEMVPVAA